MTRLQFNVAMATASLSLVLVILIIIFGQMNRSLEKTAVEQQAVINRGNISQQVGRNILVDMGQIALHDQKMRDVLTRNGFTITQNQNTNNAEGGAR